MYHGHDFYCDVAIPHLEPLQIVHEDDRVLAFQHTNPYWPTHIVAVPKKHITSLTTASSGDEPDVRALLLVVQQICREVEASQGAATVLTNIGGYQSNKHFHVHVYSGDRLR